VLLDRKVSSTPVIGSFGGTKGSFGCLVSRPVFQKGIQNRWRDWTAENALSGDQQTKAPVAGQNRKKPTL
jgi:hypothetical protein